MQFITGIRATCVIQHNKYRQEKNGELKIVLY